VAADPATLTWTAPGTAVPTIRTIHLDADGGPVGAGGSGARYITATDGTRWVMKATFLGGQAHRYLHVNEALTAQIAHRMGICVPELAAVELTDDQVRGFSVVASPTTTSAVATRLIDPAEPLSPETASAAPVADRAAIVTLDYLSWNTDEKPEHILAQHTSNGWRLWPIDHGHTFAVADTLADHVDPARPAPPPMALLAQDLSPTDLEPWIVAAESIKRREFYSMVQQLPPSWVAEPDAADILADALIERVRHMRDGLGEQLGSAHN